MEDIEVLAKEGVWGVESLITSRIRTRLKPEGYQRVINLMWVAIERARIHDKIDSDLSIVLLAGDKTQIDDYLAGRKV